MLMGPITFARWHVISPIRFSMDHRYLELCKLPNGSRDTVGQEGRVTITDGPEKIH